MMSDTVEATAIPATTAPSPDPAQGTEPAAQPGIGAPTGSQGAPESTGEPTGQPPEDDGERDPETGRYLGREAATFRRRLRETEAERDGLRTQVEALQRREVERLAQLGGLAVPADVWQFGGALESLRGEDGMVDAGAVGELVTGILRQRPGLRYTTGDIGIGRGASAAGTRAPEKVGLSALLKPGQ